MYRQYKKDIEAKKMGCGSSKQAGNRGDTKDPATASSQSANADPSNNNSSHTQQVSNTQPVSNSQPVSNTTPISTTTPPVASGSVTDSTNQAVISAKPTSKMTSEWKAKQKADLDDLLNKAKQIEDMLKAAMSRAPPETSRVRALRGDVTMKCPSASKIVRIFTSSTFTDTFHERNTLMKFGYPRIKDHCKRAGYEFQVVDMRWGVRDEATDDHMGTELCLKELRQCQRVSTGPHFVSLLSHKYGYTGFPRYIPEDEFNAILGGLEAEEAKELFNKWYTLDENAIPVSYVLASVSTNIPDFLSTDPDRKKAAKDQWWRESVIMQEALTAAVEKVFDTEKARTYTMSITETEVQDGLLKTDGQTKYALWLKRDIYDIEKQGGSYALSRYIECLGPDIKVKKAREMLRELKDERMMKKLDASQILAYNVNWCGNGGINPDEDPRHKAYLDSMNEDFVGNMKGLIDKAIAERGRVEDPILDECYQHIRFCQTKCEGFAGREDTLEKIKAYVKGPSKDILVLHGGSGTGKTSIMAMAAKCMQQWLGKSHVTVLRFLGTSPDSSFLPSLLRSISRQIRAVYGMKKIDNKQFSAEAEILLFKHAMIGRKSALPLVLILDSLDQLDPSYDGRKLAWLSQKLGPATKIIVSTLEEPEYESFPALKSAGIPDENFVSVPILDPADARTICTNWLTDRKRKLTDHQMTVVLNNFLKCPTPLFLKLSIEKALRWTSFLPDDQIVLQDTVRGSIDHLFSRLEQAHGQILVSRALAYLTLAHNGSTEAELEDILSCDDDVLNDVYMYWTPPTRRLPPLLLVRIRHDLDQFLVERGGDGVRVIYWYHRQFIEASRARYCSDKEHNKLIHSNLADFFKGTWADGKKKEFTSKKGVKGAEDRYVAQQPLKYDDAGGYNIRALNNLPHHRMMAGQADLLKDQCLANVDFILHKLEAMPQVSLLEDYKQAIETFPEDELISSIYAALCLSQKAISHDPRQVVSQLLGRLKEDKVTTEFLATCRQYPLLRLVPDRPILTRPGGQLVHCISAHTHDIDMMDLTTDGRLAVTVCQEDHEVKIWDLKEGKLQRKVSGAGQCTEAYFCHNNEWLILEKDKVCGVQEVSSGRAIGTLAGSADKLAVCGKNKGIVCVFYRKKCTVYDLSQDWKNVKVATVDSPDNEGFGVGTFAFGTDNYIVACDFNQYFLSVMDLRTKTFISSFRGFPKTLDEDGEEEDNDVETAAISPDETQLVYTSMFSGEVVFADLHGNRLRSIPPNDKMSYRSVKFSLDGRFFSMRDDKWLYIFNTSSLQVEGSLEHPAGIVDDRSLDMQTIVTVGEDCNLRIWDRSRAPLEQENQNTVLDTFTAQSILPLENSRYVIMVLKEKTTGDGDMLISVYDIFEMTLVKQAKLTGFSKESVRFARTNQPDQVFLHVCRRMFLLEVPTLRLLHTFQGIMSSSASNNDVTDNNQIVTPSRGGRNVKILDAATGKTIKVIKLGQKDRISDIKTDKQGMFAAVNTEEGEELLLVNLQHGTVQRKFETGDEFGEEFMFGNMTDFSPDGSLLLFDVDIKMPNIKDSLNHLVVWDLTKDCMTGRLVDKEYQVKYDKIKKDDTTAVDSFSFLDNDHVIVIGYDNVMRIFHCRTGTMVTRLEAHTSSLKLAVNPKADYILSYGCLREEDCMWLWNKADHSKAASYTLDKTINDIHWSTDGKFIITTKTTDGNDISAWTIQLAGQVQGFSQQNYPKDFSGQVECGTMNIPEVIKDTKNPPVLPEDKDDPDSDPEEPEDVDSDEHDDDADDDAE